MGIAGEIVEFDVRLVGGHDEFPVALPDPTVEKAGRRIIDVGNIVFENLTEDGVTIDFAVGGDDVEQILSRHFRRGFDTAGVKNRRNQVDAADKGFILRRLDLPGPAQHDRCSYATFVRATFALGCEGLIPAGGEIGFRGLLNPAVIGDVDDKRLFAQSPLIETAHEFATGFVEPFAHRIVFCEFNGSIGGAILGEETLGRIMRCVWQERGVPNEERFAIATINEIPDRFEALATDLQPFVAVASAAGGVAVGHPRGEAAFLKVALPPLSGLKADVAFLFEHDRQLGDAPDVLEHFATVGSLGRIVSRDFVLMRVETADQRGQAGSAEARGNIAVDERGTFAGQLVEVRGPDVRMSHKSVISPGLIIGQDHDHVRVIGCRSDSREKDRDEPE